LSRPVPVPTRALVVRLADYGDTDRIVGLFTRSRGLVSAIAKSARVSTKRFGGALQSGQLLDVVFGRSGGALERLESATIVDAHLGLLTDLAKLDEAAVVLRALRDHLAEVEPDPELFDRAARHLAELAVSGPDAVRLVAFRLDLFDRLGVGPELDRCVRCGRDAGERPAYVDPRQGGLVCRACGGGGHLVSAATRRLARGLRGGGSPLTESADALALSTILDAIAGFHLATRGSADR